jgi:hypothetical protein
MEALGNLALGVFRVSGNPLLGFDLTPPEISKPLPEFLVVRFTEPQHKLGIFYCTNHTCPVFIVLSTLPFIACRGFPGNVYLPFVEQRGMTLTEVVPARAGRAA